ncbi:hypothetical protein D3C77_722980 [compost metagenome]
MFVSVEMLRLTGLRLHGEKPGAHECRQRRVALESAENVCGFARAVNQQALEAIGGVIEV